MPSPLPSASNITQSSSQQSTTYTSMSVGDVEAIGAHCQAAFCHQLDFLPFRCESCRGTFCLDHRSETAHSCANAGAWARARSAAYNTPSPGSSGRTPPKPTILNHESQCFEANCKTLVNTALTPGVHCTGCRRDYCLKHRMKEDHDCAKVAPLGVGQRENNKSLANEALGRLRAWGAARKTTTTTTSSPQSTTSTNSLTSPAVSSPALQRIISPFTSRRTTSASTTATSHTIALNTLKRTAKGDLKVPSNLRTYLHVEAVAASLEGSVNPKVPRADAFYNSEWSVGRVLDAAAKTLGVTNVNNRGGGEEEKLRVFHVEGGRLLPFAEKLGQKVKSGDTIVLLRGVGDPDE